MCLSELLDGDLAFGEQWAEGTKEGKRVEKESKTRHSHSARNSLSSILAFFPLAGCSTTLFVCKLNLICVFYHFLLSPLTRNVLVTSTDSPRPSSSARRCELCEATATVAGTAAALRQLFRVYLFLYNRFVFHFHAARIQHELLSLSLPVSSLLLSTLVARRTHTRRAHRALRRMTRSDYNASH